MQFIYNNGIINLFKFNCELFKKCSVISSFMNNKRCLRKKSPIYLAVSALTDIYIDTIIIIISTKLFLVYRNTPNMPKFYSAKLLILILLLNQFSVLLYTIKCKENLLFAFFFDIADILELVRHFRYLFFIWKENQHTFQDCNEESNIYMTKH
jgi:hypothetical protein